MESQNDWHPCHFCGTYVFEGYEDEAKTKRHWLSDCRPDLVEHEIGELCTWAFRRKPEFQFKELGGPYKEQDTCYAYQDLDTNWTNEHKHFYPDGPM